MSKNKKHYRTGGTRKGGSRVVYVSESANHGQRSLSVLKYFFLVILILAIGWALYYYHSIGLIVWFNRSLITENTLFAVDLNVIQSELSHYLFSILNSILLGVYLSAVLPLSGKRSWKITAVLIIATILLAVLSLGYVGIYLFMNFPFFAEKTYISNQSEGISFFISNLPFFLLLYAISLLIESEVD